MATLIENRKSSPGLLHKFKTGTDYDTDALRQLTTGRAVELGADGTVTVTNGANDNLVIGIVAEVISSNTLMIRLFHEPMYVRCGAAVAEAALLVTAADGDWVTATTNDDPKLIALTASGGDTEAVLAMPYNVGQNVS